MKQTFLIDNLKSHHSPLQTKIFKNARLKKNYLYKNNISFGKCRRVIFAKFLSPSSLEVDNNLE